MPSNIQSVPGQAEITDESLKATPAWLSWFNLLRAFLNGIFVGTTTNDDAAAGDIGEYISSTILSGAAVSLVTGTSKTITSISLTAGDWDVNGTVGFTANAATTATGFLGGISTSNNNLPMAPGAGAEFAFTMSVGAGGVMPIMPTGTTRISIAATTTIYLVGLANFAVNSMSGYGFIGARRPR